MPLWAILLLISLLCRPPLPVDETRYLSVAWEMWQSHQFLVPHINGVPYSQKPPLLFWLIQAGWWLFGVQQWSARLTAPIFGLFSMLLSIRLSRMFWPDQRELHVAVPYLLLGTWFWSLYASLTMFDMLVVCFALIAWNGLWLGYKGKTYQCWLLYALAVGLGILAKGPVILLYIVPPALLAPWWAADGSIVWKSWYMGFILSLVSGAGLAFMWAIPAARAGGAAYGHAILFGQTAGRMVHSFAHGRPVYWYVLLLPLILFPWSFVPQFRQGLMKLRLTPPVRFCLVIFGCSFLLLSAVSGKQIHYLLPLMPPILLLTGYIFFAGESRVLTAWPIRLFFLISALFLFVLPRLSLHGGDSEMLRFIPSWLGILPLAAALLTTKTNVGTRPLHLALLTLGLVLSLHLAFFRPLHDLYDIRSIAGKVKQAQVDHVVAVYPARLTDQLAFAGKLVKPLVPLLTREAGQLWAREHPGQYLLFQLGKKEGSSYVDYSVVHRLAGKWLFFMTTDAMLEHTQTLN